MLVDMLSYLNRTLPCFVMHGSQVHVICEPHGFYEALKSRAKEAQRRITLSSLYLGTGHLERDLVDVIASRLNEDNQNLQVNVLLDYTRGSRGKISSRTLLLPLLSRFPSSCKVHLYHTPSLRGMKKLLLPDRWNEVIGLQHMKIYVFDDSVLISGANLSNDYFTNRQDRYVMFENVPKFADYLHGLVGKVSEFSLQLQADDSLKLCEGWNEHPYKGNFQNFCNKAKREIEGFLKKHVDKNSETTKNNVGSGNCDTMVYPSVGMGLFDIHQDRMVTERLLSGEPDTTTHLTTGYFNLTKRYADAVLKHSSSTFKVLMAHPTANGFLGAKGAAGGIPFAYTHLASQYLDRIKKTNSENRIQLLEYRRNGWTFHGKGLWQTHTGEQQPYLTLIGSPNFGYRSVWKDLECQVVIVTNNQGLRSRLAHERDRLYEGATEFTRSESQLPERRPPIWVRMVASFFKKFF